jgi:hypothetical protein
MTLLDDLIIALSGTMWFPVSYEEKRQMIDEDSLLSLYALKGLDELPHVVRLPWYPYAKSSCNDRCLERVKINIFY